ncbi:hypothetical protein OTU49_017434, partial [Cherax quadricarinatus]
TPLSVTESITTSSGTVGTTPPAPVSFGTSPEVSEATLFPSTGTPPVERESPTDSSTVPSSPVPDLTPAPPVTAFPTISGDLLTSSEPSTDVPRRPCREEECGGDEVCWEGECVPGCWLAKCGSNAKCMTVHHRPECSCEPGHHGDPLVHCLPHIAAGCRGDDQCPSTQACINNECRYPCEDDPCGSNAECINSDHSAQCRCRNGFQGDPIKGCSPVTIPTIGCQYNEDCPSNKACDRFTRKCLDPCESGTCAPTAICQAIDHRPQCQCPAGYSGNPNIECAILVGCRDNSNCPTNQACINNQCQDPCRCGRNAVCEVASHRATCRCPPGYVGDPLRSCQVPINPCDTDPCGEGALCELDDGNPICVCPRGTTGNPFEKCIPEGEDCEPNQCGPNSGCRIVGGAPICFCLPEFVGNPPSEPCSAPANPCHPSPCGPNTDCNVVNGYHRCTCKPGFVGKPNTIRGCEPPINPCVPSPCGDGALCDPNRSPFCVCRPGLVGDPFTGCKVPPPSCGPGICGQNAECYVRGNSLLCRCLEGYDGDPQVHCRSKPDNPCERNPCGPNTQCSIGANNYPVCSCTPGFFGEANSDSGCKPECTVDDDCSHDLACVNTHCIDPCPSACGINSLCEVNTHRPVCFCPAGFKGNPYTRCDVLTEPISPMEQVTPKPQITPCSPSPCGLNTECRVEGSKPICSCIGDYIGDPKDRCRPECVSNADCDDDKSCIDQKCGDPCPGLCGTNALCDVVHHNPICYCPSHLTGDPFRFCVTKPVLPKPVLTPCEPNPCGPNSVCRPTPDNTQNVCSCLPGFMGSPCRPECTINSDCPMSKACINLKCVDPCVGSCGIGALCNVVAHNPICRCADGLTGNPFSGCFEKVAEEPQPPAPPVAPCTPSCGANAECQVFDGVGSCVCLSGFYGEPELGCTPECIINSHCVTTRACINQRCIDPCADSCGVDAICKVLNHNPICSCPDGYVGDPFRLCLQTPLTPIPPVAVLCQPNPCGENARCTPTATTALCTCLPGFRGDPYVQCRPDCVVSSDCPLTLACISQKCRDPCPGTCGNEALCSVISHNPVCVCPEGYMGDPFSACQLRPIAPVPPHAVINPCMPNPCGPNTECRAQGKVAVCECLPGTFGNPNVPSGCKFECVTNAECPMKEACDDRRCRDPCVGTCGLQALCDVVAHNPVCRCPAGYTGDPFYRCTLTLVEVEPEPVFPPEQKSDPCTGSPCGSYAQCSAKDELYTCSCTPGYVGNPYTGCRPECTINSECPLSRACVNQLCVDPCPGSCGLNADCHVLRHQPNCFCHSGYTGDPYTRCHPQQPLLPAASEERPCELFQCGPNSQCRVVDSRPTCSCLPGFFGNPPASACRPECILNTECPQNLACRKQKCVDPCPGVCGIAALCEVVNHNPICYCPKHLTGDPFIRCAVALLPPEPPRSPCAGDPCGPNAICREVSLQHQCSCQPGYMGTPPACRPECVVHAECSTLMACVNNRCVDPCKGTCGIQSQCRVINHNPVCSCIVGYTGDPFTRCTLAPVTIPFPPAPPTTLPPLPGTRPPHEETPIVPVNGEPGTTPTPVVVMPQPPARPFDPCSPDPCGSNTICRISVNTYTCECRPGYFGNPDVGCGPECVLSSDCKGGYTCVRNKCINPCPSACASTALCTVVNHRAICNCPPDSQGDPYIFCAPHPIAASTPSPPPVVPGVQVPCEPNPCGQNAECLPISPSGECRCLPDYYGNPYDSCQPECTADQNCPFYLACINQKCLDPCPGTCGISAECQVVNHAPVCYCKAGHTGDPYQACRVEAISVQPPVNLCSPSPCGPNSKCHVSHNRPICECLPAYFGKPPNCQPECIVNSDCETVLACVNQMCRDPCVGTCGTDALCEVINHNPICYCPSHLTGDPFIRCFEPPTTVSPPQKEEEENPCDREPCGHGADCSDQTGVAVCTCKPGLFGNPYHLCRHECVVNSDCSRDKACSRNKCVDPCPGACGVHAECVVKHHSPTCTCPPHLTGDPFSRCVLLATTPVTPDDPCSSSP